MKSEDEKSGGHGWGERALSWMNYASESDTLVRGLAVASNLVVIAGGFYAGYYAVVALHLVLLPINAARLARRLRDEGVRAGGGSSGLKRNPARHPGRPALGAGATTTPDTVGQAGPHPRPPPMREGARR